MCYATRGPGRHSGCIHSPLGVYGDGVRAARRVSRERRGLVAPGRVGAGAAVCRDRVKNYTDRASQSCVKGPLVSL